MNSKSVLSVVVTNITTIPIGVYFHFRSPDRFQIALVSTVCEVVYGIRSGTLRTCKGSRGGLPRTQKLRSSHTPPGLEPRAIKGCFSLSTESVRIAFCMLGILTGLHPPRLLSVCLPGSFNCISPPTSLNINSEMCPKRRIRILLW